MLKPFQTSPVAVGARLNANWVIPNPRPGVSLSGELLFPVASGVRVRASLVDIVVKFDSSAVALDSVFANTNLSLDAVASTRLRRSRIWPYAWLGPELGGRISNLRLGLRAGIGIEGMVQSGTAAFGELGVGYAQPITGTGSPMLRARIGAGVRLGSFAR